jgi:hypothetical protein
MPEKAVDASICLASIMPPAGSGVNVFAPAQGAPPSILSLDSHELHEFHKTAGDEFDQFA